jgi:anti-sigma regulatory factor (Ser/Thr protein kinase)
MQARDQRCGHQEPWPAGAGLLTDGGHRRIALDPAPESTRTARDFTIETLHGWRLDALIQDTVMVVSELVANAIRHGTVRAQDAVVTAEAQVELSWCYQASRLICTVTDRSCKPPLLATADFDAESGRGLQVVHALAVSWGWTTLDSRGKAVWAAFQLPAPADARATSQPESRPGPGAMASRGIISAAAISNGSRTARLSAARLSAAAVGRPSVRRPAPDCASWRMPAGQAQRLRGPSLASGWRPIRCTCERNQRHRER